MKSQPVNDTKPPRPGRTVEAAASSWLRALQDSEAPIPKGLCAANGSSVAQRFGVYRNNVLSACVNALADTFPVCQAMVGQDFFHASLSDLCWWRHVQAGLPLGEALASASMAAREWDAPEPDIQHGLRLLVQHRLITHVITPLET